MVSDKWLTNNQNSVSIIHLSDFHFLYHLSPIFIYCYKYKSLSVFIFYTYCLLTHYNKNQYTCCLSSICYCWLNNSNKNNNKKLENYIKTKNYQKM